jgi:methylenetetrahydrofolate dehydrogenase (NADP+)/methenyltetrahydrofolate cyclohydrolase
MHIMDGKLVAKETREQIKNEVNAFYEKYKSIPGLAVVQVGDNQASSVYVRNKHTACREVGMVSYEVHLPENISERDLLHEIELLNNDIAVDGILVQLPLPKHINESNIINAINPSKDVDAFHPINVGKIMVGNYDMLPCTPAGVMTLLDYYNIDPAGQRALIIGRSNIVGKPMMHLMLERNATVVCAHSKTRKDDLLRLFAVSDIVISATGVRNIIDEDDAWQYFKDYRHDFYNTFKKRERVIIDVGINRDENGKLCGDFSETFKEAYANFYTPVPGGVGPMTITSLLRNTLKAAEILRKQR